MRNMMRGPLVAVAMLMFASESYAQDPRRWDLAAGYSFLAEFDRVSPPREDQSRTYHGWSIAGGRYVTDRLAISADVDGVYDQQRSGNSAVELSIYSALVGIRVTALQRTKYTVFGDALVGVTRLGAEYESYTEARHYGAFQADFGVDVYPWQNVGIRAAVGYRHFLDSDQARLATGFVLLF